MKKIGIVAFLFSLVPSVSFSNPYLPKPGERPLSMRVSTCAVSGGFVHLYTALDNGLFDKYGIKLENIFIRGGAQNLTALATDTLRLPVLTNFLQFPADARDAILQLGQRIDARGADAHRGGHLAVLRDGAHLQPDRGPAEQGDEQQHCQRGANSAAVPVLMPPRRTERLAARSSDV